VPTVDELRARLAKVEAVARAPSAAPDERAIAERIAARVRSQLAAQGASAVAEAAALGVDEVERRRAEAAERVRMAALWLEHLEQLAVRARYLAPEVPQEFVEVEGDGGGASCWGSGGRFERPGWG